MKVLIVDDNIVFASRLKIELSTLGYLNVDLASDAESAIDLFKRQPINLIFINVSVAGSESIEFITRLSEISTKVRILLLGCGDARLTSLTKHIASCLGFNFVSIMKNPSNLEELHNFIKEIENQKQSYVSIGGANRSYATGRYDVNELCVYFQPQVDLSSGQVIAAEAVFGAIDNRLVFVPLDRLMEKTPVIKSGWFESLLQQSIKALHVLPLDISLSIKFNVSQLKRPKLLTLLVNAFQSSKLPFHRLTVELVNLDNMISDTAVLVTIARLRLLGIRLSIGNAGGQLSSVSNVSHLPIDELKVGRELVHQVDKSEVRLSLLQSIADFSQRHGIRLVATDVETRRDIELLLQNNITIIQSDIIDKPKGGIELYLLKIKNFIL